jgi:hypothetical protein
LTCFFNFFKVVEPQYNELLRNVPVRHAIERAELADNVGNQLKRFSDLNLKNIFVVGSAKFLNQITDVANDLNLFGPKLTWFALTKVGFSI